MSAEGLTGNNSVDMQNQSVDYYDYELEDSFASFDWTELGPSLTVYSITFIAGILGNILILVAVARHTHVKNSPVNVFLASLASADLLLILVCLPLKVAKLFSYTWTMGWFSCKLLYYLQTVSGLCSVLNLTALSIERYYAIVHPLKAQYLCTISKAKKIVLITWSSALALAAPILLVQVHKEVGVRYVAHWCVRDFDSKFLWRFGEMYLMVVILVLPAIVMIFSYGRIIMEVCRVFRQRETMTHGYHRAKLTRSKSSPNECPDRSCHPSDTNKRLFRGTRSYDEELETTFGQQDAPTIMLNNSNDIFEISFEEETLAILRCKSLSVAPNDARSSPQPAPEPKPVSTLSSREVPSQQQLITAVEKQPSSTKKLDDETKQVVRMLIFIVVLYIVCWGPLLVFNVLQSFEVIDKYLIGPSKYVKTAFSLMAYFNSCINPIVYGFMSKNFRESFLSDLRTCCPFTRIHKDRARRQLSRCGTSASAVQATALNCSVAANHSAKCHYRADHLSALRPQELQH